MKIEQKPPRSVALQVFPLFAQFFAGTSSSHTPHNKSVVTLSTNPQRSSQQQALLVQKKSLIKLYVCECCSDELKVLMKSLLLPVSGSVPRKSNHAVPDRNSFPQPQIGVGTFHFLEKRVQYRIST